MLRTTNAGPGLIWAFRDLFDGEPLCRDCMSPLPNYGGSERTHCGSCKSAVHLKCEPDIPTCRDCAESD